MQNFTPLSFSAAEKSVTVQRNKKKQKKNKMTNKIAHSKLSIPHTTVWLDKNKCVSRLARRIPHRTALSNAAARNSQCPPTVVTIVMGGYSHLVPSGHLPRFSFSWFCVPVYNVVFMARAA